MSFDLCLSAAQTDVWLAQQLSPGSARFNLAGYAELVGDIDVAALDAAMQKAAADVDALRLRFRETTDGPSQFLDLPARIEIPVIDCTGREDPGAAAGRMDEIGGG